MLLQHSSATVRKPGIVRPGIWRLSAGLSSAMLSVAASILVARTLGPGAFGVYTFVLWLATVSVPAIGVGISTLTRRHLAHIQGHKLPQLAAGIFRFVWQRQCRSILLYCLIYLLLAFPLSWLYRTNAPFLLLLLAGLSAPPLLLNGVVGVTLRGQKRFGLLATLHLLGASIALFLVAVTISAQGVGTQIGAFLLASAIAGTCTLLVAIAAITRLLPLDEAFEPGALLKDRLTRGMSSSLLLFTLDAIVWQPSELLLLAYRHSATELGFYALSALISTRLMETVPVLLSSCVLPMLLRYFPGQRYSNAADAFRKTSLSMTALAIPLCLLAIWCCPFVIAHSLSASFLPIVTPLRILLIAAIPGSIATVSLTHLADGERRSAQVRLGVVTAALTIGLALPCIALWGITGAALASAAAQLISATGSILICKRFMSGR